MVLLLEQMKKIWSLSFLPISRSKSITRARIFLLNIYSYKSFFHSYAILMGSCVLNEQYRRMHARNAALIKKINDYICFFHARTFSLSCKYLVFYHDNIDNCLSA